jgi:hypothetical protein
VTLEGYASHAEFEAECQRCHDPLNSLQGELCLGCHTRTAEEIETQDGPHSLFEDVLRCFDCHSDHQGREFDLTASALEQFNHEQTSFSLIWHLVDYEARPIDCQGCHTIGQGFSTPVENCIACHGDFDAGFMTAHEQEFGRNCLDCHDGVDRMVDFDHAQTDFALLGQHASTACAECHQQGQFEDTPVECAACHSEPETHAGLFTDDCAGCHNPDDWKTALWNGDPFDHFAQFNFSLERHLLDYAGQPLRCVACHFAEGEHEVGFAQQECTDCHQQADAAFMAEHIEQFGPECIDCHDGSGRMANFDHSQFFVLDGQHADIGCESCHADRVFKGTPTECSGCHAEPPIHAGLFGLQCENCHSTQAWAPASLTSHSFPLDHGEQGLVACETCHTSSYVEYTCYGCHEHQQAETEREHAEEGISRAELSDCARCHPNGLEDEAEGDDD